MIYKHNNSNIVVTIFRIYGPYTFTKYENYNI